MDINETVAYCTDSALKIALDVYGKTLDFGDESIVTVSEILDGYHERYLHPEQDGGTVKERPNTYAHIFGVYVGEVLRRNYANDHTWQKTEYGLVLAPNEKNHINPIGKAYKQIVGGKENGDDIKSFFDIAILIVQGKFPT